MWGGRVFWVTHASHSNSSSVPKFLGLSCIYAYNLYRRTTKFSMRAPTGRGVSCFQRSATTLHLYECVARFVNDIAKFLVLHLCRLYVYFPRVKIYTVIFNDTYLKSTSCFIASTLSFLLHDAMSKRGICCWCLPLTVTLVYCTQTAKDIVILFFSAW